jgi:hypothetical protein
LFRYNLDYCFKLVIIKIITQLSYHFKPVESLRDSDLVGPGPPCRRGERQVTRTLLVTGLGPGAAAPAVGSRVRVADKHRDWHGLVDSSASDPAGFKFTVIDSESALLGSSCLLRPCPAQGRRASRNLKSLTRRTCFGLGATRPGTRTGNLDLTEADRELSLPQCH